MKVTAIIPAYNEIDRIDSVLNSLIKVKRINEIIVVDDNSSDGTYDFVKENYPSIKILRNYRNLGKSGSIKVGLQNSSNENIFLCDADLKDLLPVEVDTAIMKFFKFNADLIILRRKYQPFLIRLLRADVLLCGERILKKKVLEIILKNSKGFELEIKMNKYFMDRKSKVFWTNSSAKNSFKHKKRGLLKGFIANLKMYLEIYVLNLGFIKYNYLGQILFFGKQETPSY